MGFRGIRKLERCKLQPRALLHKVSCSCDAVRAYASCSLAIIPCDDSGQLQNSERPENLEFSLKHRSRPFLFESGGGDPLLSPLVPVARSYD